jgi:hypothetical protein
MRFIPRVDEVLVAPPYMLGKPPTYKFCSHVFILDTDNAQLQKLIEVQLNDAVPNGPVSYVVPESVQRVWLAFVHYDRAEAETTAGRGWFAYNEALIGFLVLRKHSTDPEHFPNELLTYLGAVYIDDSAFTGQLDDPHSIPIVLGREAYGLPKNPGQIRYSPTSPHQPNQPRLQVWDVPKDLAVKLKLDDAIVIEQVPYLTPLSAPPRRAPYSPDQPSHPLPPFDDLPFFHLALQFGIPSRDLLVEDSDFAPHAVAVTLPRNEGKAIAWEHLLWKTKLVGLKQFPDPRSKPTDADPNGQACYQAIVETPIGAPQLTDPQSQLFAQRVRFPLLDRNFGDLMTSFAIQPSDPALPREVQVNKDRMYYREGVLRFANPDEVNVWDPL